MNDAIITKELLEEFGIDLTDKDTDSLLAHLNETLQERVGTEITQSLTDEQLATLVALQEKGSDEEVSAWLEQNVPELQAIIDDEIDILLGDLDENTEGINNA